MHQRCFIPALAYHRRLRLRLPALESLFSFFLYRTTAPTQITSFVFILIYALGLVASIVDLCFESSALEKYPRYLLDSVTVVFLFVGVVTLASVIHLSPLRQPFRNLLYLLRAIMLLFTINKFWQAVR